MDELEISGKRYISSRRAAKEHGYHSDYIGQLIRGGKVVGQKVGRSWYVSEESLLAYFNEEKTSAPKNVSRSSVEEKEIPTAVAGVVEETAAEETVEKLIQEEIQNEIATEITAPDESVDEPAVVVQEIGVTNIDAIPTEEHHIALKKVVPIKRKSNLRYIEDDISFEKKQPEPLGIVLEERAAQYQGIETLKHVAVPAPQVAWGRVVFLLALVGIFTFGITFGISSSLAFSTTLKGTLNTASVVYGL